MHYFADTCKDDFFMFHAGRVNVDGLYLPDSEVLELSPRSLRLQAYKGNCQTTAYNF